MVKAYFGGFIPDSQKLNTIPCLITSYYLIILAIAYTFYPHLLVVIVAFLGIVTLLAAAIYTKIDLAKYMHRRLANK